MVSRAMLTGQLLYQDGLHSHAHRWTDLPRQSPQPCSQANWFTKTVSTAMLAGQLIYTVSLRLSSQAILACGKLTSTIRNSYTSPYRMGPAVASSSEEWILQSSRCGGAGCCMIWWSTEMGINNSKMETDVCIWSKNHRVALGVGYSTLCPGPVPL